MTQKEAKEVSGKSRAEVKIYGQTYTITGEASRDYIKRIAKYVDDKMEKVAAASGTISTASVAVLAAIHITEELYQLTEEANQIQKKAHEAQKSNQKHDTEISNYQRMWEETKSSFHHCRQELQTAKETSQRLKHALEQKGQECDGLLAQLSEKETELEQKRTEYEKLQLQLEEMEKIVQEAEKTKREAEVKKKALDEKEKEFENEFIEIQMKNIKLENEIEKYRKEKRER